jgi:ABC-2 type transport system ATP-binding protein
MSDVIVAEGLTKYYGRQAVVNALNLRIPAGCVYGLLGRNGAGKSTAIKMLLGLVRPDRGGASLLGEESGTITPETRSRIAYLAEGHPLYRWMSVGQMVRVMRAFHRHWNDAFVAQILDHFELPQRKKIRHLSRGQRAQLALALAMAPDPELLILDDPTIGLDTVVRRDFLESMVQIIQRRGRTILFSSHIMSDVERIADRVGVLVDGVLRVDCPTETFKQTVKKVVVDFGGEPPEFPACAGIVGTRQVGKKLEIITVRWDEEQRRLLEQLRPLGWEVVDLNLEDAFIEYTRGARRPLPVFVGEQEDVESVGA